MTTLQRRGFVKRVAGGCATLAATRTRLPAWLLGGSVAAAEVGTRHRLEVAIENRRVPDSVRTVRVTRGDTVEIRWTADEATTIHLHGYDLEVTAQPSVPALMTFDAYATGRFPVAVHNVDEHRHGGGGGHSHSGEETILLYLEVHPR